MIGCTCEVCMSDNPKDKRLRSSVLLNIEGKHIVIDTGPDFRQQILREGIDHLDAILITHEHNDHVAGLDDIRPFNFMQKEAIRLYSSQRVLDDLKSKFNYAFEENKYPGAPSLLVHPIGDKEFSIDDITFLPIRYMHGQMPVLGFRVNNFAYLTDIKSISTSEIGKLVGLSTLTISALHHDEHHSHFNLQEALSFIAEVKPRKAYLTHVSHRMGKQDSISDLLPENVFLAYDGLELTIS